MRIVHLLKSDRFSGAENIVCQIIDMFKDETGVEMIYVSPDGPIHDVLDNRNICFRALREFSQHEINYTLNELKPDIIHAHDCSASVRAAISHKTKVISHLHNNPKWMQKLCINSLIYALTSSNYKKIITVSNIILSEYIFRRLIKKKCVCLPNIVDSENVITKALEGYIEPIDVLYVGRFAEQKNPLGFLRIIKEIAEQSEKTLSVIMLGVGPLRTECERYIEENKLTNSVNILGFDSNPYKYMKAAKLVIMPSLWEGFGLVAVEAMILGKTVLASPVGGLIDILKDGGGILCENEKIFIEQALHYLVNEDDRKKIGLVAVKKARRYTDKENYKRILKNLYFNLESS